MQSKEPKWAHCLHPCSGLPCASNSSSQHSKPGEKGQGRSSEGDHCNQHTALHIYLPRGGLTGASRPAVCLGASCRIGNSSGVAPSLPSLPSLPSSPSSPSFLFDWSASGSANGMFANASASASSGALSEPPRPRCDSDSMSDVITPPSSRALSVAAGGSDTTSRSEASTGAERGASELPALALGTGTVGVPPTSCTVQITFIISHSVRISY